MERRKREGSISYVKKPKKVTAKKDLNRKITRAKKKDSIKVKIEDDGTRPATKNSYINGIKDLVKEYDIQDAEFMTKRGLKNLDKSGSKEVPLRKLKNRESAKNSRKRRKRYMELMERKVSYCLTVDKGPGDGD